MALLLTTTANAISPRCCLFQLSTLEWLALLQRNHPRSPWAELDLWLSQQTISHPETLCQPISSTSCSNQQINPMSSVQQILLCFTSIFTLRNYKQDSKFPSMGSFMGFCWSSKTLASQGWRKVTMGGELFYGNKELSGLPRDSGFPYILKYKCRIILLSEGWFC